MHNLIQKFVQELDAQNIEQLKHILQQSQKSMASELGGMIERGRDRPFNMMDDVFGGGGEDLLGNKKRQKGQSGKFDTGIPGDFDYLEEMDNMRKQNPQK